MQVGRDATRPFLIVFARSAARRYSLPLRVGDCTSPLWWTQACHVTWFGKLLNNKCDSVILCASPCFSPTLSWGLVMFQINSTIAMGLRVTSGVSETATLIMKLWQSEVPADCIRAYLSLQTPRMIPEKEGTKRLRPTVLFQIKSK